MNEQTNGPNGFEMAYKTLKLEKNADWAAARNHYRKLVHRWHPDKFSDRPTELENAQKQFIVLTKSYNKLKDFYALHKRLPFEHTQPEKDRPDAPIGANPADLPKKSNVDPNNLDMGTLSRDKSKVDARLIKKSPIAKILWSVVAIVVVVGTIMLFFILDQKASQKNLAIAREVLKEAPESEFTPTASEIRRSESKGVFLRIPD
jgi:curved DNA-binding protein CbpA